MTTILYNYDSITGERLNDHPAEISPLDQKPVIMAFSTLKVPPNVSTNQRAVYRDVNDSVPFLQEGGQWKIVPDYRGQVYWDESGAEFKITEIGVELPKGAILQKPEESIEILREKKIKEIKVQRDAHEFGTFFWNGHKFDCNQIAQQRIIIAVLGAQTNSDMTFDWRLADNSLITLTASDMIKVAIAMGQNTEDAFNHANALEAIINTATTKEELDNIVW